MSRLSFVLMWCAAFSGCDSLRKGSEGITDVTHEGSGSASKGYFLDIPLDGSPRKMVEIAEFSTTSAGQVSSRVSALLLGNGITTSMSGSRAIGVWVGEGSAERARAVLAKAIREEGLEIYLKDDSTRPG